MEDRRTAPRIDTEAEVELESDHNFYMGFTENVSEGGLFVATVLVRPIGTKLTVRFTLPGRPEPIVALGEVRWTRPYHDRLDVPSGMGIQFVEMVEEHQAAIRDFVRKRDPIFYDD